MLAGKTLLDINRILEKASVTENMTLADLGCGSSGYFVFNCAKLVGKEGNIYAVDVVKQSLKNIDLRARQENIENIKTIWSDLEIFGAAKIEANSLDVAFLVNTLYQSKKRAEVLRESIRMLKKDGKLVVIEWKDISSPFGPDVEIRVKKEPLKIASQKLGLSIENEFEAGPYHYGLIFVKL